ncbi:uncharacterized protein LOC133825035 [Humulus lupulus]|uniref:uncharacterized protein LOC133825035 n=1 Tax=Humulus lupulus TaxID=3486 RepID=UPI002B40226E|nr:uncharacterized protein LOC133825035 [Humulus lupulus]
MEDYETVALIEECSAIIEKKLPQKLRDLGSFTIPCTIGNFHCERALCDLGELRLRVQGDEVVFNVFKALKYPSASDSCFSVNVIEERLSTRQLVEDPLEMSLIAQGGEDCDGIEVLKYVKWLNSVGPIYKKKYEELGQRPKRPLPSIKKPPILELKYLLDHLKYAYLGKNDTLSAIISASLSIVEEENLLRVLRAHKLAICWTLADIKGISPSTVMHPILVEEDNKAMTEWRIFIDYRKINKAKREDHFQLPFVDQMLDRQSGHQFYCFLDGYSDYHQIPIAPEDQEKTNFTCPYGTFAFCRMPFGLCNALATFQRCMLSLFSDMVEKSIEMFMDDFSVFGSSFDLCLQNLEKVLTRCEESNLVLNLEKCHFKVSEGIVLGHKISSKGIEVDRVKVSTIENLPPSILVKGVKSFLGHTGFYRRFIKDF